MLLKENSKLGKEGEEGYAMTSHSESTGQPTEAEKVLFKAGAD